MGYFALSLIVAAVSCLVGTQLRSVRDAIDAYRRSGPPLG